ncbi:MAG: 1-acyl-sn-glycerol-3-phosphate acyltransferase [Paludibacteraceae bacterium]|nr:1-acyl-sn-glycerol-3-phosphate acyltransferase [Paludibacteraceae bacterium]
MKYLYRIYQVLVFVPIMAVATLSTALITIVAIPWKNAEWLHRVQQLWARLFCYLLFIPVTVSGVENITSGQSYVFVSNHQSFYDVFAIYGWLPVIFKWLMKAEVRKIPFVGTACKAAGHIFVDRIHPKAAAASIKEAENVLHDGVCTVIFPEGTRTRTGEMGTFKRGAFQIALDLHLPVIPISLTGCYQVMNPGDIFVNRHPIHMHIGEPIDLSQVENPIEYVRNKVKEGIYE